MVHRKPAPVWHLHRHFGSTRLLTASLMMMAGSLPAAPPFVPQGSAPAEAYGPQLPSMTSTALPPQPKTPVSELVELAMRMGLVVKFDTSSETGPSHSKSFAMCCSVGDVSGQGSGASKKKAKHEAATVALERLKESQCYIDYVNQWTTQAALAPHNNPIARLQEVVAKKGLKNPEFELTRSEGPPHQTTFETTVTVGNMLRKGTGRSKKEAKRKAAAAMLDSLSKSNLSLEPPAKRMAFVPEGSCAPAPVAFTPAGTL